VLRGARRACTNRQEAAQPAGFTPVRVEAPSEPFTPPRRPTDGMGGKARGAGGARSDPSRATFVLDRFGDRLAAWLNTKRRTRAPHCSARACAAPSV
jgi:hypothetical protein